MIHQTRFTCFIAGILWVSVAAKGHADVPTQAKVAPVAQTGIVDLSKLTLQKGKAGVGRPKSTPISTQKAPGLQPLDFAKVRPQLAKLLSIPVAAVPSPTHAQVADQPGNTVRVSFDTAPTAGVINANFPRACVRQAPPGSPLVYAEFEPSSNPGSVSWWIPAVAKASYLVTCYVTATAVSSALTPAGNTGGGTGAGSGSTDATASSNPGVYDNINYSLSSIRYDIWDGAAGLQGQQVTVQSMGLVATNTYQGVFMMGYVTSASATLLSAIIYMPNDRISSLNWCDVMRVN